MTETTSETTRAASEGPAQPSRLWSVTSIIGEGMPSPALKWWAAKTTAEWAVDHRDEWAALAANDREAAVELVKGAHRRTSKRAMARGTDVHRIAEALAYGEEPEIPEEVLPYVTQYQRFREEFKPRFLMAEAPVYNRTWSYAGTLDAIAALGGLSSALLDIKTTDKPPDGTARPPYPEVAIQLCAYERAEFVGLGPANIRSGQGGRYYIWDETTEHAPMPETDGAFVLVISPFDFTLTPVATGETVWNSFLAVREVARWKVQYAKNVLGPPVGGRVKT